MITPEEIVFVTVAPNKTAPANSMTAPIARACETFIAPVPTEVPRELATSFAPNAALKQKATRAPTIMRMRGVRHNAVIGWRDGNVEGDNASPGISAVDSHVEGNLVVDRGAPRKARLAVEEDTKAGLPDRSDAVLVLVDAVVGFTKRGRKSDDTKAGLGI